MSVYRIGTGVWSTNDALKNWLEWIKILSKLSVVIEQKMYKMVLKFN